jgi:hypothetical protein
LIGRGRNRLRTSPGWVERSGRASGLLGPAGHLGVSDGSYRPPRYDRPLILVLKERIPEQENARPVEMAGRFPDVSPVVNYRLSMATNSRSAAPV